MPIYTKTGDSGQTSLFGGKRLSKSDPQIEAYGTVDELTSFLGMIIVKTKSKEDKEFLTLIQKDLYQIMGVLAGANSPIEVISERVKLFEQKIDVMESKMPKLHRFILPGGTETASWFHIVRTVCRRAERSVVAVNSAPLIIQYLNRLSDLLFVLARYVSLREGKTDSVWKQT